MIKIHELQIEEKLLEEFLTLFFRAHVSGDIQSFCDLESGGSVLAYLDDELSMDGKFTKPTRKVSKIDEGHVFGNGFWKEIPQKIAQVWNRKMPLIYYDDQASLPICIPDRRNFSSLLIIVYLIYHRKLQVLQSRNEASQENQLASFNDLYHNLMSEITDFILFNENGLVAQRFSLLEEQIYMLNTEKMQCDKLAQAYLSEKNRLVEKVRMCELEDQQNRKHIKELSEKLELLESDERDITDRVQKEYGYLVERIDEQEEHIKRLESKNLILIKDNRELTKSLTYHKNQVEKLIPFEETVKSLEPMLNFYVKQTEEFSRKNMLFQNQMSELLSEIEELDADRHNRKSEKKRLLLENSQMDAQIEFLKSSLRNIHDFMKNCDYEADFAEVVQNLKTILDPPDKKQKGYSKSSLSERHEVANLKKIVVQLLKEIEVLVWRIREEKVGQLNN